jgi:hypothetical protein
MKFQIWCTVHHCPVIAADNDMNMILRMHDTTFEIDESNLYCLMAGPEHEFMMRVAGDSIILDPPE